MGAAQRLMRPVLPRKFFKAASAERGEAGFELRLDGKSARTPAKAKLQVASHSLAEAMAEEWNALGEFIDPAALPLTRIVNAALDGVTGNAQAVRQDILAYAGSDLLCYRALEPPSLVEAQDKAWSPLLAWAQESLGVRLMLAAGIVHVAQQPSEIEKLGPVLTEFGAIGLAALHSVTTLTGSAILALALARGEVSGEAAWQAAHVDEDWQIFRWGSDAEAERRRATRWRDMAAAAQILGLRIDAA